MADTSANRILGAIERLNLGDRDGAIAILSEELRLGPESGEQWKVVHRVANGVGELDIALEASRRYALTRPTRLDRVVYHATELATNGRTSEALEQIAGLPAGLRDHPSVQLFLAMRAAEAADFARAESLYREAIPQAPLQAWAALTAVKTFAAGDSDLADMERLLPNAAHQEPRLYARFLGALGKAYDDCGDFDRAWDMFDRSARIRRGLESWDPDLHRRVADSLIRDFNRESLNRLVPVSNPRKTALFVTGLPRSGTTLVEQILVSHSQIADSAELDAARLSLSRTIDHSFAGAMHYQTNFEGHDPWGRAAADYFRMLRVRFRTDALVVDKTPLLSLHMGLLLHMLPEARVLWVRRNPEDAALSCFRAPFSKGMAWSWSLEEIGRVFAVEDLLFRHWSKQFPDRINAIRYEDLVRDPEACIPPLLEFVGLPMEPQVLTPQQTERHVRTASIRQVRGPISPSRIGAAEAYPKGMDAFRRAYCG